MRKYLIIVLMVGSCYCQNLYHIYTKDGPKYKTRNISQITDSTIFLNFHNISIPVEKINKLLIISPYEEGSLFSIGCMSALIIIGASYALTPPTNIGNANLNLFLDLIGRIGVAVVLAPPTTFGMFLINQVSRIKVMDMNDWSIKQKINYIKQLQFEKVYNPTLLKD